MTNEAVLAKLQKLLALAENEGATQGERDNAWSRVNDLLEKHQLELADIVAQNPNVSLSVGHVVIPIRENTSEIVDWKIICSQAVGEYTGCKVLRYGTWKVVFIGETKTLELAEALFKSVCTQLYAAWWTDSTKAWEAGKIGKAAGVHGRTWKKTYLMTAARSLFVRMHAAKITRDTKTTALVVQLEQPIKSYMDETWGKIRTTVAQYEMTANRVAESMGSSAADKVRFLDEVGKTSSDSPKLGDGK